jgi:hypothetical protein
MRWVIVLIAATSVVFPAGCHEQTGSSEVAVSREQVADLRRRLGSQALKYYLSEGFAPAAHASWTKDDRAVLARLKPELERLAMDEARSILLFKVLAEGPDYRVIVVNIDRGPDNEPESLGLSRQFWVSRDRTSVKAIPTA